MLVFFGFTFCPDVCPTELQKVAAVLDGLGPRAARIAPLFISVDHERDGPAQLAEYTQLFDERIVGLSGTAEQIAQAARAYRVYYGRTQPAGASTFLYDHSAFLYLMGPDGRLRAIYPPSATVSEIQRGIESWLDRAS
jgi:protein SCO1/2